MVQLDRLHRQRKREEMELAAIVKQEERGAVDRVASKIDRLSMRQKKSLSPNRAKTSIPTTRMLSPANLVCVTQHTMASLKTRSADVCCSYR